MNVMSLTARQAQDVTAEVIFTLPRPLSFSDYVHYRMLDPCDEWLFHVNTKITCRSSACPFVAFQMFFQCFLIIHVSVARLRKSESCVISRQRQRSRRPWSETFCRWTIEFNVLGRRRREEHSRGTFSDLRERLNPISKRWRHFSHFLTFSTWLDTDNKAYIRPTLRLHPVTPFLLHTESFIVLNLRFNRIPSFSFSWSRILFNQGSKDNIKSLAFKCIIYLFSSRVHRKHSREDDETRLGVSSCFLRTFAWDHFFLDWPLDFFKYCVI